MAWLGFDSERLKYPQSGLGKFCEYLGKALMEQGRFDIQFFQKKKTKRIFAKPAQYGKLYSHNKLMGVSTGVDVWHCTHQSSAFLPSDKSIPVVTTIHGLNFIYESSQEFKVKRKLGKVQQLINRSSALVFVSQFTADEVARYFEVPDIPTQIIPHAPALPVLESLETETPVRQPYFLAIGPIAEKKNFHTLLPLLLEFPEHDLVIAGNRTDPYAAKLLNKAQKLGVDDRLVLPGEITEKQKVGYYRGCDAFFHPSLMEGFGLPVVEAMAFGKPLFLSPFGSLPEVGGDCAFYWDSFTVADMAAVVRHGLARFTEDAGLPAQLKTRAELFSWQKAADAYGNIYDKVLAGR